MPAAAGSHHQNSLAGLTLDDVLANRAAVAAAANADAPSNHRRTLLDIIREDESNKKDRKSWKAFKDKLRLKRAGSAWTSSILIPASDISIPIHIQNFHKSSLQDESEDSEQSPPLEISPPVLTLPPSSAADDDDSATRHMADPKGYDEVAPTVTRQGSTRMIGDASYGDKLKPQMSRPNSARLAAAVRADSIRRERVVTFRDSNDDDDENDEDGRALGTKSKGEHRQMSAREAVAAQEAAEAAAAKACNNDDGDGDEEDYDDEDDEDESGNGGGGMTMSLMDLLEETDRQMGLEGSRYRMEDDDDEIDDEEYDEEDEGGIENDCCVCMVKHKGPAFVPCGHAFCRMCSRELTVTKGNCPLCNNFILEILDIF